MTKSNGPAEGNMRAKLVGLHTATKRLAGGKVRIYAYETRGGALLASGTGSDLSAANAALEAALGSAETLQRLADAKAERVRLKPRQSDAYMFGLVTAYFASAEYTMLKRSTKEAYTLYLERFRAAFGDDKLTMFDRPKSIELLTEWRDSMAETPRAADYAMSAVGALFKWARGRGKTLARPTENVSRLHSANRADIIWTDADIAAFCAVASKPLRQAVLMAAYTGLRQGDLLRLGWASVSEVAITLRTSKRNRVVAIPLLPIPKEILADIKDRDKLTVLTSSYGRPWTSSGFRASFRKACQKAGVTKHFHDLRGTAVTKLAGLLTDDDIATWMGWSPAQVRELKILYVSGDVVALDMLARMERQR